jgi:GAF domain-containing protein
MAHHEISEDLAAEDWPGESLERQHIHSALTHIENLQRTGETDFEAALLELNQISVPSVPGAEDAGVTFIEQDGKLRTMAPTGELLRELDEIQRETQEGPCLSAAWNQHTIHIADLRTENRWPRYRDTALERTPVRSVLCFRLFGEGRPLAALNFTARRPGAFTDDSIEMGLIFASHLTLAWNTINREQHFQSALASRDIIGQAKGMLMERFDIDAVAAFDLLARLSQQTNSKLSAVAEQLVNLEHPRAEGS